MKNHFLIFVFNVVLATIAAPQHTSAQKNKDSIETGTIRNLVNNRQYTFKAETVTPLAGRLRQLTSDYDLQVAPGVITAYLPYYGQAYTAPINPADGGIQFTSKDFAYSVKEKKKDGWDVSITTKDVKDNQQMQLSIFNNGRATLQVTSNNRQSISFSGYVTAPDKKK